MLTALGKTNVLNTVKDALGAWVLQDTCTLLKGKDLILISLNQCSINYNLMLTDFVLIRLKLSSTQRCL